MSDLFDYNYLVKIGEVKKRLWPEMCPVTTDLEPLALLFGLSWWPGFHVPIVHIEEGNYWQWQLAFHLAQTKGKMKW